MPFVLEVISWSLLLGAWFVFGFIAGATWERASDDR